MIFNINDYVEYTLTENGAKIYNEYYSKYNLGEYKHQVVSAGDVRKEQLWCVMQVFGPKIIMGTEPPFVKCELRLGVK